MTILSLFPRLIRFDSRKLLIRSACLVIVCGTFWSQALESQGGISGLQKIGPDFVEPVYVTSAPGDPDRVFIATLRGKIEILDLNTGTILPQPFLTIADTDHGGSGGLQSIAFHPDYQNNGKFYVHMTVDNGGIVVGEEPNTAISPYSVHIREFTVSANPDIANTTPTDLLTVVKPQQNHNGGWLGFSPNDGYLYVTLGDGGSGNDKGPGHIEPTGNAQDKDMLLGKILRIDVDGNNGPGGDYGIPPSNPFVGVSGRDEIWAYGMRNPFRASFDRATGDFIIGDVGQASREEIDFQLANSPGGENYGWRLREGLIQTPGGAGGVGGPKPADNVDPVYEYLHDVDFDGFDEFEGGSIIGGYVYRGPDPTLQGKYFFTDSESKHVWTLDLSDPLGTRENVSDLLGPTHDTVGRLVSWGEDVAGNLYLVDVFGGIYSLLTDEVISADFDGSSLVNGGDLADWQSGFGTSTGAVHADGDADLDEDVDGGDFLYWQRQFGSAAPVPLTSLAVPEPNSTVLLALAIAAHTYGPLRRRRLV